MAVSEPLVKAKIDILINLVYDTASKSCERCEIPMHVPDGRAVVDIYLHE